MNSPVDGGSGVGRRAGAQRPAGRSILFAVPDLDEPYFAELTALVLRRAEVHGLAVVVFQTWGDHQREVDAINGVGVPATGGLLHIPRSLSVADLTRRATPGPMVLLGEHIDSSPFAHVTIDNHAAAAAATRHLLDNGCSRLAMIGPRTPASDASDQRFAGYGAALRQRGLPVDEELVGAVAAFTPDEGRAAVLAMLAAGTVFDGVVCANDSIAFGVLAGLWEASVAVPGQVRVIGLDGLAMTSHTVPPLSTVAPDREEMVAQALRILTRQMQTAPVMDLPVEQVTVPFTVIARTSTT